jgi:hypothetical protein
MKCIGDSSSATEAIIHVYQESYDERWTMQKEMYDISTNDLRVCDVTCRWSSTYKALRSVLEDGMVLY